jgi:hypothetical protein
LIYFIKKLFSYRIAIYSTYYYEKPTHKINDLVKFSTKELPKEYHNEYPFKDGEVVLFMGYIGNMQGHVIVANKIGRVFWGYHPENFIACEDDDI